MSASDPTRKSSNQICCDAQQLSSRVIGYRPLPGTIVRRRDFITLLGGAAAGWPLAVRAQQVEGVRRIAILMGAAETASSRGWIAAFSHRLDELGWREGRNLLIQVQWWNDEPEQMRRWAADLIARSPDVAVTFTNFALEMLKPLAGNVPIVFSAVGDPVGSGFVASLAQPGGNITGFASHESVMGGKWLGVLKETAPTITRALAIMHPETPSNQAMWQSIEEAAPRLGIEVTAGGVHNAADIERVIASFAQNPNGGLIALPHAVTLFNASVIIALAQRYRMPDVFAFAEAAAAGGLVSYGIDWDDQFRRVAEYVDRILKGTKPSDLPVQNPTQFKLVVNLKTAKVIGLTVPPSLVARADEVIE
jgi:putative tryptophan/tyrosine transport system substrate-binding protein